jgi:Flp pilus assembly protein TadG
MAQLTPRKLLGRGFRLWRDTRGVAAVEFALGTLMLAVGLLNVADIGLYTYSTMEVDYAAQMGAMTALKKCNTTSLLPATQNCSGLSAAITTAIQSTTLGTAVTLAAGSPSENYYCINTSNALVVEGTLASPPSDCTAAGEPTYRPGDYLLVQVSYSYSPLFAGVSVMSASTISPTSWVRLN